jgi:trans-aconitate methyltransferase
MFDAVGVGAGDGVVDVGGGASGLVDALLERGHADVSVLDVSADGLAAAQQRLGANARRVRWIVEDLRAWRPDRTWRVWHDRAVLHFFTTDADRQRYLQVLSAATEVGSLAVFATFAPDGPQQCSGLPVARYDAEQLAGLLGSTWRLLLDDREQHATPAGGTQSFTWAALRRDR